MAINAAAPTVAEITRSNRRPTGRLIVSSMEEDCTPAQLRFAQMMEEMEEPGLTTIQYSIIPSM
jgi:hypothetical protein